MTLIRSYEDAKTGLSNGKCTFSRTTHVCTYMYYHYDGHTYAF